MFDKIKNILFRKEKKILDEFLNGGEDMGKKKVEESKPEAPKKLSVEKQVEQNAKDIAWIKNKLQRMM
ncbi:MAG: hypothetical protein IH845_03870 [Nanoarchaeota archaeon]|nr:hypothetical protein [Nanoarchaeota archaeon]